MKQIRFNLVIPKWLREKIAKLAKDKGVSISEFIKDLLKNEVNKNNI